MIQNATPMRDASYRLRRVFAIIKTLTSRGDKSVTKLHRIYFTLFQQTKLLQNGLPDLSIYYVNI